MADAKALLPTARRIFRRLLPRSTSGLKIPGPPLPEEDYARYLLALFADPRCRIYLDTSFLMWLTAIGKPARVQFQNWIKASSEGRYVVPVWAAQEYQTHLARGTLSQNLDELIEKISSTGSKAYKDLHRFLQVPLTQAANVQEQQEEARRVLNDVWALALSMKGWRSSYQESANAVTEFVNDHPAHGSGVLRHLAQVQGMGEARYESRVPPGYQDRNKKEHTEVVDDEQVTTGSNKWGDLIFWLEIIELTKRSGAEKIIVLTNDRKNDWRMAGRSLSTTHPMLVYEAANEAGASEVVLVDAEALARMLTSGGVADVDDLRRAGTLPTLETPLSAQQVDAQAKKARVNAAMSAAAGAQGDDSDASSTYTHPPNDYNISEVSTRNAVVLSRRELEAPVPDLFGRCMQALHAGASVVEVIRQIDYSQLKLRHVVALARALHDAKQADPAALSLRFQELVLALDGMPGQLASCYYLGFMASAYFLPGSVIPRGVPESTQLEALMDRQKKSYAAEPLKGLAKLLREEKANLIFVPSGDPPFLKIDLGHEQFDDENVLNSIRVGTREILEREQGLPNLLLRTLLGGAEQASGQEISDLVCKFYGIHKAQMKAPDFAADRFALTATAGLVAPDKLPPPTEKDET